jgi:hypothetical protein
MRLELVDARTYNTGAARCSYQLDLAREREMGLRCEFARSAQRLDPRRDRMGRITTSDGTGILYKDSGSGQPIVFSHGWPLSADDWDTQLLFFPQHGYRVIAHDRRGLRDRSGEARREHLQHARPRRDGHRARARSRGPHLRPRVNKLTVFAKLGIRS